MNMRALLGLVIFVSSFGALHCASNTPVVGLSEDTIRKLSLDGEKYVDEELKRALFGVKQMKEVMERNEEKHGHLMKSLKHSSEKKKGMAQLALQAEQKLGEAERECRESLNVSWDNCRPCLEDACKTFYTSTCRRGFSSFSFKVEEFFRKVTSQFKSKDNKDVIYNQSPDSPDVDLVQMEDSFSKLQSKVHTLYDKSVVLFNKMRQGFDYAFQAAFTNTLKPKPVSPAQDPLESGFLQGVRLDDVLDSFFDFGKSVIEEFSSVITETFDGIGELAEEDSGQHKEMELFSRWAPSQNKQLCRDLRRQTSECWQLQSQCESCQGAMTAECPTVRELHVELNEVSQQLNVSRQQYQEVLLVVQHHTQDTINWLSDMADRFGWVADLAGTTVDPEGIFSITAVVPYEAEEDSDHVTDTSVDLNILNSPPFTLNVPAELKIQDPAFIQYVAQEALATYKQMAKRDDVI